MILKYKVPKAERKIYRNKKVLYCEILQTIKLNTIEPKNKFCYLVKILNYKVNVTAIFTSDDLKKINFFESFLFKNNVIYNKRENKCEKWKS